MKLNIKQLQVGKLGYFLNKISSFLKSAVEVALDLVRKFKETKLFAALCGKTAKKIYLALIIFIGLIQAVFAVLIYGVQMENKYTDFAIKIIPYPIAVVNQDFVTYRQFNSERDYIHHFYNATKQENIDFEAIDKEILNQLIENKIIAFEAKIYKVKVGDDEIDRALNDIVDQNGGTEKVSQVLLDLYGLNLKQFRKLVKTQLLRDKFNGEAISKVKASHILIRIDRNAPQDKVAEAKAKIEGIAKEISGGLDFGEAAKKYSEDVGSAEAGGELEPFARGEMVPEFSDAAFKLEKGKVSDPIQTDFGWHIIKVSDKTGKIDQSFSEWISGLKKTSLILKLAR